MVDNKDSFLKLLASDDHNDPYIHVFKSWEQAKKYLVDLHKEFSEEEFEQLKEEGYHDNVLNSDCRWTTSVEHCEIDHCDDPDIQ